ncbi:hypothetical protein E2C01_064261 [Portunus trituberculatus]|uniref:Uncharacterized protein n=1 Tax=Portunus trituberculatus TaxID=210409 RepID=A0A5B7HJ98_PORTR|nr:hypothetical protein [Portunus trituberculatus]
MRAQHTEESEAHLDLTNTTLNPFCLSEAHWGAWGSFRAGSKKLNNVRATSCLLPLNGLHERFEGR